MKTKTNSRKPARSKTAKCKGSSAPCRGYLALGSELGELMLIESIVRDHATALDELAKRLRRTSELLGQMRDNIRQRWADTTKLRDHAPNEDRHPLPDGR